VYQSYKLQQQPITFVDVGAATGDTILLLYANCPNMIGNFYCVDGDLEFNTYLRNNLAHLKEGKIFSVMLSASEESVKELVRTHSGTASAQGTSEVASTTLDALLQGSNPETIDIIKIDVDGFDGKVLCGARQLLSRYRPAVIFEWHPIICQQTSNNWIDHFDALKDSGYTKFIWFTKFGEFSHFTGNSDSQSLATMAKFCLESKTRDDWHYDVIALHESSLLLETPLAELAFASARSSYF
jgi:FkbM family methyltransferase